MKSQNTEKINFKKITYILHTTHKNKIQMDPKKRETESSAPINFTFSAFFNSTHIQKI